MSKIAVCIVDSYDLKRDAVEAMRELGVELPALFITNERASKYNVRGRIINKVYLYGLLQKHVDSVLRDSLDAAAKSHGTIEYVEVA